MWLGQKEEQETSDAARYNFHIERRKEKLQIEYSMSKRREREKA